MTILEQTYAWARPLARRSKTDAIILHHAEASACTARDIHRWHLANGWAGIGYHYFVEKNGLVYRGRPENTVGAHAGARGGYNSRSIGVCFEGNYQKEAMPAVQLAAGRALLQDILGRYGRLTILGHRDVTATTCPGDKFPMDKLKRYNEEENDMTAEQVRRIVREELKAAETRAKTAPPMDYASVAWRRAEDQGILDGTRPGAPVQRQELAVVLDRIGALKG